MIQILAAGKKRLTTSGKEISLLNIDTEIEVNTEILNIHKSTQKIIALNVENGMPYFWNISPSAISRFI